MSSYNLMKKADRDQLRADRTAELKAVKAGQWPRDLDDQYRWMHPPTSQYNDGETNRQIHAEYAAKMCKAELAYLDDVEARLEAGAPDLEGWEK